MQDIHSTTTKKSFSSLFIAHGAPINIIDDNEHVKYIKQLGKTLPKPKAIVLFSAHWESPVQMISSAEHYSTMYDYNYDGFPQVMYQMTYPAKGNPNLALEIQQLFGKQGIESKLDSERGLDHGAWTLLKIMYPDADIPVVALSVNPDMSPEMHYKTGAALKSLKERGVLIIGSGGTVHNLGRMKFEDPSAPVEQWAIDFDKWLANKLSNWETKELFDYIQQAPHSRDAIPTPEHFMPLFVAMGAGEDDKKFVELFQSYRFANISYNVFEFH